MKEEFELDLQNKFPFMKRNIKDESTIHNTYQAWGCECSSGWYELIRELCQRITNRYATEGISANDIDLKVLQIKEKFATLRFYYTFEGAPYSLQAIDFLGTASLRFDPQHNGDTEFLKILRHDISELVRGYEKWSAHLCEYCGKRGTMRKDLSWKKTLCDDCYNNLLKSIEGRTKTRKISIDEIVDKE